MPTFWDRLQANVGALLGTGKTADELQRESHALDEQLANFQRTRNEENPALFDEEYNAQFQDHLQVQRNDTAVIPESIEDFFEEGYAEGQQNVVDFGAGVGTLAGDVVGTGLHSAGAAAGNTLKGAGQGFFAGLGKLPWWVWPLGLLLIGGFVFVQVKNGKQSFAFAKKFLKK
jgi:hypothetical protein